MEKLEDRRLLAADLYCNDDWHFLSDVDSSGDLSIGDLVSNANDTIAPGSITKAYGTDAFGTVTSGTFTGSVFGAAEIQDAVNAANPLGGDTVIVLEGTYTTTLGIFVDRSLTLLGAQSGVDAKTRSAVPESTIVLADPAVSAIIAGVGIDLVVDGFTMEDTTSLGGTAIGFGFNNSTTIKNNILLGFHLAITGGNVTSDVTIQGNSIVSSDFDIGISLSNLGGSVAVGGLAPGEGNAITAGAGIGVGGVSGNATISGNEVVSVPLGSGIFATGVSGNVLIQGNTVSSASVGIEADFNTGPVVIGGTGTGEGNTIQDSDLGAIVVFGSPDVQILNNVLSNVQDNSFLFPSIGIWLSSAGASGNPVLVSGNSISGAGSATTGVLLEFGAEGLITGGTSISGLAVGVDNTNGANLSIAGAAIYDNDIGVRVSTSATVAGLSNVDFFGGGADNGIDVQLASDAGTVSFGNNLKFRGNSYFIDNQSSQSVNLASLSGTTYDETNNFRIEDKMYHAPDNGASGLIGVVSGQLFVTTPGTGASDETIQAAIAAASSGDTINIEAGTYTENVDSTSNSVVLSLGGSGVVAAVTIDGSVALDADDILAIDIASLSVYDQLVITGTASLGGASLSVASTYVPAVGDSFTIIDTLGGVSGTLSTAFVLLNFVPAIVNYTPDDVLLIVEIPEEVWVNDTWLISTDVGPAGLSLGDTVESNTGAGDTPVTGKIFGYNAYSEVNSGVAAVDVGGVVYILAGTYSGNVEIAKNLTISGQGDSVVNLTANSLVGISVDAGYDVAISGVKVSSFLLTGIYVGGHVQLTNSTVTGGFTGIFVGNGGILDMASTIVRSALLAEIVVSYNAIANISTSEIIGTCFSMVGVLVAGGEATILNSIITGNAIGVKIILDGNATIHDSNLAGNWLYAVANYTGNVVDAEGNWWGSAKEKKIKDEIFGLVDYSPWLTSGADQDGGDRGFDG